jgi:LmbE family N-acetylglucosaminyl deacetylase
MTSAIAYHRRNASGGVTRAASACEIFPNWQGRKETWLFLSPHDDDVVCGACLLLAAAVEEKINVHCVVTTDGRMGYCDLAEKDTIAEVRRRETEASFRIMGVADAHVHFLGFPDGNLGAYVGRRVAARGDAGVIAGHTGLENAYVHVLRKAVPTRVIIPTSADLHPDHKIANMEMQMGLIHACGAIWPELGEPIPALPAVYEYATYSDFPETPQIKIVTSPALLEKKMAAIMAYASQRQIAAAVQLLREAGPIEYIRELNFRRYSPANYEGIF